MSSQPTDELNEHVCHWEENPWVVVFFRFFESGSFFSLFFSSFCLCCCPKMETVFRVIFYLFRNSEGAIRGHQFLAVLRITLLFWGTQMNYKTSFNNTTK